MDHVDYYYNDFLYPTKHVEFYFITANGEVSNPPNEEAEILGHMYLNVSSGCDFVPFRPPKRAGRQKIQLEVKGLECDPVFQFIGDKYLTMTVRADLEMVLNDIR